MDVVQSIWLSSVTGAGLFFSVGLLVSRAFPPKAPKAGPSPELQSSLQGEREARLRAEEQVRALERNQEEGGRLLAEERSQAAALRTKLQSEGRAADQLQNEARLREQAQQEVQRLSATVARFDSESAQLRGEADAFRTRLQHREAELSELRVQLAAAENRAALAQKAPPPAPASPAAANANARVQQLEAKVNELTRKASEAEAKQREVQQLTSQLTATQAKLKEVQQREQQLTAAQAQAQPQQQVAALQQQLAAAQAQAKTAQQLQQQLTAAQAQARSAQQLQAQLTEVQAQLKDAQALAQQLSGAQAQAKEAQQLAQELIGTQAQLRDVRAQLTTAENRAQETPRLRDENAALRQQLKDSQKGQEGHQGLAEIQRRNVELSLKARALEQRSQEFEMQAAEIESLRTKVDQLTSAANETDTLRKRVRDLEARGYADRAVKGEGALKRPTRRQADDDQRLENLLEGNLEALVKEETGCRTAVLADLRGLLIAASGDITYQDELAAASSLTTYTTERIRQLIPMGEPLAIQFIDVNRVVLRIEWLRWQNDAFLLSTLGVAPEPGAEHEDRVQTIMSELLGS